VLFTIVLLMNAGLGIYLPGEVRFVVVPQYLQIDTPPPR